MNKIVELTLEQLELVNGGFGGEFAAGLAVGAVTLLAFKYIPFTIGTGVVAGALSSVGVGCTAAFLLSGKSLSDIDIKAIISMTPFIAAAAGLGATVGVISDSILFAHL